MADGGMVSTVCSACGDVVGGPTMQAFGDAYVAHVHATHPEMPYPDVALRNWAEATQRLTGPTERLDRIGDVTVHHVTEDRLDDWLDFFDHDAFADNAGWAACYCAEPHVLERGGDSSARSWQDNRDLMIDLLRAGRSFGYLAYVDGRPAAWVNASKRSECALYRLGPGAVPADGDVASISCFVVAPPYRRHGLAAKLLGHAVADAAARRVAWIEAYPATDDREGDSGNFHGPRSLFSAYGFEEVTTLGAQTVMRRRA